MLTNKSLGKLHRKGNKTLYLFALILLWISTIVSFAGDWISSREAFVSNNDSPLAILGSLSVPPSIGWDIPGLVAIVTSDSILVRLVTSI